MKKIKIETPICELLEKLHYETNSYAVLISFLIKDGVSPDNECLQQLKKDFFLMNTKYNIAKQKFEKDYNLTDHRWKINFLEKEVEFNDKN